MAKTGKKQKDEERKQLLILKATYQMQLKTRDESLLKGKEESVERIDMLINETLSQMSKIDPEFTKKCVSDEKKKNEHMDLSSAIINDSDGKNIFDELSRIRDENKDNLDMEELAKSDSDAFYKGFSEDTDLYALADSTNEDFRHKLEEASNEINMDESMYNNIDPNAQYDIIPLPSRGECYKNKIDRIPVAYLTASDENLITSPNLYESGSIINILLKKKILNKDIDVDSLVSGDVDAIMVFLRGTSYGNNFPITATDPKSGKKIDTDVDLSKLKYRQFTLKGDENGYFDFTLPRTKNRLKFKFLTKKDEKLLQKLNKNENGNIISFDVSDAIQKIKNALQSDKNMSDANRNMVIDANNKLKKWLDSMGGGKDGMPYTKTVTNTMEMQIVSINGNTDRDYIHNTVMNMPASDSLAFRRYVYDNQPGVNFEVEVERPESMGGGSFKCFLEWDDYVFWHIS